MAHRMAPLDQFVGPKGGHRAGDAVRHAEHLHARRKLRSHSEFRRYRDVGANRTRAVQFAVAPRIGGECIQLRGRRGHFNRPAHLPRPRVYDGDSHAGPFGLSGSATSRLRFARVPTSRPLPTTWPRQREWSVPTADGSSPRWSTQVGGRSDGRRVGSGRRLRGPASRADAFRRTSRTRRSRRAAQGARRGWQLPPRSREATAPYSGSRTCRCCVGRTPERRATLVRPLNAEGMPCPAS